MYLENIVVDAVDPAALGRFWEAAIGGERLTDEPGIYETRLEVAGGPVLDLCFQQVADAPDPSLEARLVLHLRDGASLAGLGGGGAGPHADPEGNPYVVESETATATAQPGTGPVAALALASADPERDAAFWSWLTGWAPTPDPLPGTRALRHPSGLGPVLVLHREVSTSTSKNRWHLDLRLEADDEPDVVAAGIAERGGREWFPDWGELPWRFFTDPSGNEVCLLAARS